jgi:hypothetical protein
VNADPTGGQFERVPCPGTTSPIVEGIKGNAEAVIQELAHLTDFEFGYNRQSVVWLEGLIERMKKDGAFKGDGRDKLISAFGSYLGECVVHCYGGEWKRRHGAWAISFSEELYAFPYAAVGTQVDIGVAGGIRTFFDMLPIMFIGGINLR